LAAFAVKPLVVAFVDVAVVVHLLDELSATVVMAAFTGLNEIVVADLERLPYLFELPGHFVAVIARIATQLGGTPGNLDRVFVVPHEKEDAVPFHAAIACLYIGADFLERGADVRTAIGIINRRGQEVARRFSHANTSSLREPRIARIR